jgi:hypothetical protein
MTDPQIDNEYGDYPIFISSLNSLWAHNTDPDLKYGDFYLAELERQHPEAAQLVKDSPFEVVGKNSFPKNVHDLVGGYFGRKYYFESGEFATHGLKTSWRKNPYQGLPSEKIRMGPSEYDPDPSTFKNRNTN